LTAILYISKFSAKAGDELKRVPIAIVACVWVLSSAFADAPGKPGIQHVWAPAAKQAIGTAYEATSPVWFTIAQGVLTETFYPSVDQAQNGDLQFIVTDGSRFFSEQKRDAEARVAYSGQGAGSGVILTGSDRSGAYSYQQELITDPRAPVIRIRTTLRPTRQGLKVYLLWKPAIGNTGADDHAAASPEGLFATQAIARRGQHARLTQDPVVATLVTSVLFSNQAAGYVGTSDGWQDLSRNFKLTQLAQSAGPGNVALVAELALPAGAREWTWDTALAYGPSQQVATTHARGSLRTAFDPVARAYESGWTAWVKTLTPLARSSLASIRSALVIKMHEDKRNPGAIVASMSKPAVPGGDQAGDGIGGYHLVWPRDLYHAAMGLLAAGDVRTPVNVLRYLERMQLANGAWSQNFWTDGTPYWTGLQLDEVGFPILLAHQLKKNHVIGLSGADLSMVRRAADFIVRNGPASPQERWEEIGGYMPNTIAVEIASLRAASALLGDARFAQVAETWAAKIEEWTAVPQGPWGSGYYMRVSPSGQASRAERIDIANGGGPASSWEILDGGFLDLARLGIRRPDTAPMRATLAAYESAGPRIAASTGLGSALAYRRYNRDAYGYRGGGGYWPLLGGERGHLAILEGDFARARDQLAALEGSALSTGMIPEQTVGSRVGQGERSVAPGVACPLVWAHAEELRLQRSLRDGRVFDAP